jgi:hypothetical protein
MKWIRKMRRMKRNKVPKMRTVIFPILKEEDKKPVIQGDIFNVTSNATR